MPVMTGLEAARQIYQFDNNARILFLSGLNEHKDYQHQVNESFPIDHYRIITKPVKKDQLKESIDDLFTASF